MTQEAPIKPGQVNPPREAVTGAEEPVPSSFRLIFTLGLAGFLSGLLLVLTHQITKPLILANKAAALREAVLEVVPGATSMQQLVPSENGLVVDETQTTGEAIYAAYDDAGQLLGYAIPGEGPGYQDTIRLLYGYDPATRRVVGMRILDSRETPGLGDRIYKDPVFNGGFKSLSVDPTIELVKGSTQPGANQVHAITGATISSRSVINIINAANTSWLDRLPKAPPPAPGAAPGTDSGSPAHGDAGVVGQSGTDQNPGSTDDGEQGAP